MSLIKINKLGMFLLLLAAILAGCTTTSNRCPPQPNYYLNPQKPICAVGRVALIELGNHSTQPQISVDMTDALFEAVESRRIFGLAIVRRSDPACKGLLNAGNGSYSLEQLALLRKNLKSDAVLYGEVTQYHPYPRLAIGLRVRMMDLRDGTLIWAIEQLWDTTDKQTENRIEDFFKSQIRSGYDPLEYRMAMVSSRMFLKFVAYEVGQTMYTPKENGL
jgi:hypothetical protein